MNKNADAQNTANITHQDAKQQTEMHVTKPKL